MPSFGRHSRTDSEQMRMKRTPSQIAREERNDNPDYARLDESELGDDNTPKQCCGGRLSVVQLVAIIIATIAAVLLLVYLLSPVIAGTFGKNATASFNNLVIAPGLEDGDVDMDASIVFTNGVNTGTTIKDARMDGPFLRAVALSVIPDQVFADLAMGLGVLLPANISFFNPIDIQLELLDLFLNFTAGEVDPNDPFGGLISGLDATGADVDPVSFGTFSDLEPVGAPREIPASSTGAGDVLIQGNINIPPNADLNPILADRLQNGFGPDGSPLGLEVGDNSFMDFQIPGDTPIPFSIDVSATMEAFTCDLGIETLRQVRLDQDPNTSHETEMELLCLGLVVGELPELPDLELAECALDDVDQARLITEICLNEVSNCMGVNSCAHVLHSPSVCRFPEDVLEGPLRCWLELNGFAGMTPDFTMWSQVVECVQLACE